MKKILATSIIFGVAIMLVGSVLPAIAQPDIGTDAAKEPRKRGHVTLFVDTCFSDRVGDSAGPVRRGTCIVVVDSDHNGCDRGDKRILMPERAVRAAGLQNCVLDDPRPTPE